MRDPLTRLCRALRGLFFLGALGVLVELLLIEHHSDWRERLPLFVLGGSLVALALEAWRGGPGLRALLRLGSSTLVVVSLVGLYLHYRSNEEFQRELHPELEGWGLFLASMRAHSPPSLAPAVLVLLGILGWLATRDSVSPTSSNTRES